MFSKMEVLRAIFDTGLVPVFYHSDPAFTLLQAIKALVAGGCQVMELPVLQNGSLEVLREIVKNCAREPEAETMAIGAGSVIDPETAAHCINSGASFISGPLFSPDVARVCNRHKIPYVPGCSVAADIMAAHEAGCDIVKTFPGGGAVNGPSFIRTVMDVMPWSRILATGIKPNAPNVKAWMQAGAVGLCVSELSEKDPVRPSDWATEATPAATELLTLIKNNRYIGS